MHNNPGYGQMLNTASPPVERPMSALESNLHSSHSTMCGAEVRLQDIISRLTGPVPVGVEKAAEQMGGLVALSERTTAQAQRVYDLIDQLSQLL